MSIGMSVASFICALLVLIPLPGHWRARNVPTLSIIAWLFIVNITHGINTIAWANNIDLKLLVWCDITIRLDIACNLALPAACFSLCLHLERVASVRHVRTSASDKRRRMIIDLILCLGLPLIYIALFYIVQGHRFDIVEVFGCQAEDYVSIPEFFLVWLPPIIFALGTFVLAGLAFMHFFRRRATFARHLANTTSTSLTPNRYFRLMSMALIQMFWSLLLTGLNLSFNYAHGLRPWTNWDDVHSNWLNVNRFPLFLIPAKTLKWTYFLWWTTPISTLLFIAFFAFGQETLKDYKVACLWVKRNVFRRKESEKSMKSLDGSLPRFYAPNTSVPTTVSITDTKSSDTLYSPSSDSHMPPPAYSNPSSPSSFPNFTKPKSKSFSDTSSLATTRAHSTISNTLEVPILPPSATFPRSFTESVLSYYEHGADAQHPQTQSQTPRDPHPDIPEDITPADPSPLQTIYRAAFPSPSRIPSQISEDYTLAAYTPATSRSPSPSPSHLSRSTTMTSAGRVPPTTRSMNPFEGSPTPVTMPSPPPNAHFGNAAEEPEGGASRTIRYTLVPDA